MVDKRALCGPTPKGTSTTTIRKNASPRPKPPPARIAWVEAPDPYAEARYVAERLRRQGGGLAGWSTEDLEVWLDDWEMRRRPDGVIVIDARDPETAIGLDLEQEAVDLDDPDHVALEDRGGPVGAGPPQRAYAIRRRTVSASVGATQVTGVPRLGRPRR